MRSRWSLTSAMMGKSAAMMRRSSTPTRSSSPATGRWTSRRETGATCWLTSLGPGERPGALADVPETDVYGEDAPVQRPRLQLLALLLQRPAEPIQDPEPPLVTRPGQLERAAQDRLRDDVRLLLEETRAQRLGALQLAFGRAQRFLELRDGLVQQAHLLERDPQIVVRLEVGLIDVLVDPLPEARQHLVEVPLLVAGRLLVRDLHARVPRRRLLVEDHRGQVDELPLLARVVAHLHLGVPGSDLPLLRGLPRLRLGLGRRSDRREHRQRRVGALVRRVVLGDALVYSAGLVRQVLAQQRVRELEIRVDELPLVAGLESELHLFLPVPHAVRLEPQDLVHQRVRLRELPEALETQRGVVELLDAALAIPGLDQRLPKRLVRPGVVGVVGDVCLQLFDGRRRRRRVDVGERERAAFLSLLPKSAGRRNVVGSQVLLVDVAAAPPPGNGAVEVRFELKRRD